MSNVLWANTLSHSFGSFHDLKRPERLESRLPWFIRLANLSCGNLNEFQILDLLQVQRTYLLVPKGPIYTRNGRTGPRGTKSDP